MLTQLTEGSELDAKSALKRSVLQANLHSTCSFSHPEVGVQAVADVLAEMGCLPDAHVAGEHFAARHAELAVAMGIPFARLTPAIDTDWNDIIQQGRDA